MENSGAQKPRFFWQAVLIILPLILLVAVGLYSLRQDRIMAESEAKERAQAIADDLHGKIQAHLSKPIFEPQSKSTFAAQFPSARVIWNSPMRLQVAFQVSPSGELIFPPPVAPLVPSPVLLEKLSEEQAGLWQTASKAEFCRADVDAAITAYRRFLSSNPPEEFAARAEFALGLLLQERDLGAAKRTFIRVADKYPLVLSDAGFSLAQLARIKLNQIAYASSGLPFGVSSNGLNTLCRDAVLQPTLLTTTILDLAEQWKSESIARFIWSFHNLSRQLYLTASKRFELASLGENAGAISLLDPNRVAIRSLVPAFFWVEEEATNYLVIKTNVSISDLWFICRAESNVHYSINHILENAKNIPDYFGVSVELAGREVARHNVQLWSETYTMGRKGGTTKKTFVTTSPDLPLSAANDAYGSKTNRWLPVESAIFATATGTESAGQFLKVNIHLSSPTALYKHQRTRSIWFGGLILVSALAAFAGLASAYRSFQQQVRLSEMKSNFVSSVSHELRAPVASMRLMAEALDRGKIVAAEKQKEYYGFIVQECRRLSSMVENVLDFSRIDQGRKEYQFEPTDLQTLVEQTVKLMEPYAAERQVTLALANPSLSTLHSSLSLDGMALQQALINLVDNAIKHSPAQATVNVGLESDEASVRLWVEDCGAGIPAEEQEKIFERFYRRGSELRRETQGIGIGLTIVKHIVAAHGGRVIVQSGVGQGSRFTMELPVNDNLRKEI